MSFPRLSPLALLLALMAAFSPTLPLRAAEIPMYIGTYATKPGGSQGIYLSKFNTETGAISTPALVATAVEPSFLVQHPTKPFIYAVSQVPPGGVSAFAIEEGGQLRELNRQPSMGKKPTHLAIDREGKNVLVANYTSGSVACLPIAEDGSLKPATGFSQHQGKGADPKRQEGPHAHSIYVDRADEHVYSADLGLDKIMIYRFNPAVGSLDPADPPFAAVAPGSGSRHLAFSARDEFIYCVNELNNTVTVFANQGGKGTLKEIQSITTLPADFKGSSNTSEVQVHPNGKFLYVSNRDASPTGLESSLAHPDAREPSAVFLLRPDGPVHRLRQHAQRHHHRLPRRRRERQADAGRPASALLHPQRLSLHQMSARAAGLRHSSFVIRPPCPRPLLFLFLSFASNLDVTG
jgi:6-phosphogluconolactonase